jgi:hypothetical protein
MDREAQGYAWASQAGAVLSNPFASELARDSETPSLILLRKWPCDASSEIFGRKCGVALGFQARMFCKNASASVLASVFSTTNPSFAQRISPYFLFSYLTRSFPLISPCGPTSGCSTAHLPRCLVVFIRAIRGLKMLYSLRE